MKVEEKPEIVWDSREDKNWEECGAAVPDFQPQINLPEENANSPEEKIWDPASNIDENSMSQFINSAKLAIIENQKVDGIEAEQAQDNSTRDSSLEYVMKVVHQLNGNQELALDHLRKKKLPHNVTSKWTEEEVNLFTKGLKKYTRNLRAIRKNFLPKRTQTEIVEFYYMWKRSGEMVKGRDASRPHRYFKHKPEKNLNLILKPNKKSINCRGPVTRSKTR